MAFFECNRLQKLNGDMPGNNIVLGQQLSRALWGKNAWRTGDYEP